MRYIWQHISDILNQYEGSVPLTHFLKNYFRKHPKLGSRDRKLLSEMSYSFYRCNKAIVNQDLLLEERIRIALFLCNQPTKHLNAFLPAYDEAILAAGTREKIDFLKEQGIEVSLEKIFTQNLELSSGISKEDWLISMLQQPRLFIRIRKEKEKLLQILEQNAISYESIDSKTLSLQNGAPVDKLLPEEWYVVQDASSQKTGRFFNPHKKEQWYDCCSGAGGKSLLLKDLEPAVAITVSDVRESILHNLKMRFKQYGYPAPKSFCLNVSDKKQLNTQLGSLQFDRIISDVPCSGSGTWARTPEQLYFFKKEFVDEISQRQSAILNNIIDHVKPGGKVFYITCSVFRKENEDVVATLAGRKDVSIEKMELINGLAIHADSMFIAEISKQ